MAGDELVRRVAVAMLPPALGQHVFILRFQHREPPDLFKIACVAEFGRQNRQSRSAGHSSTLLNLPPVAGGREDNVRAGLGERKLKLWRGSTTITHLLS